MNKEEILAMEAGEKLDRLVATEVMGEPMPEITPENALALQLSGSPVKSPKGNWLCLCRYEEGDIPTWRPLPYSTDFSAAGQVVEKLNSDGYELHAYSGKEHSGAGFTQSLKGYPKAEGKMRMPEAICKAALLTKLEGAR